MKRYEKLISHIDFLENCKGKLGQLHCKKKIEKGKEIIELGGWNYTEEVRCFLSDLRAINYGDSCYEVLENEKIDYHKIDFANGDFSRYSDVVLVSLMQYVVASERFCDGLIAEHCENGFFAKVLKLLKNLDYEYEPKFEIKTIQYSYREYLSFAKNETIVIRFMGDDSILIEYADFSGDRVYPPAIRLNLEDTLILKGKIKDLSFEIWEEKYEPKNCQFMDGYEWSFEIYFEDGSKKNIVGLNVHCPKWQKFRAMRKWIIEKLLEYGIRN